MTTSELLKNYFFSRDTISEYEAKWAAVFEKDDDAKSYWDTEIETGRMKRAVIDIFFDSFSSFLFRTNSIISAMTIKSCMAGLIAWLNPINTL